MRREVVGGWLTLLVLASGCTGSGATSDQPAASKRKPDLGSDLHRPLRLPSVATGAACPRTPGGYPSPDVAIALGSGPAYPVLGLEGEHVPPSPEGVVPLYPNERRGNVYWHKTLWAVDPAYNGPVLIRGRGIDPPQALRFVRPSGAPGGHRSEVGELEMPAQESDSWRYGPSVTILPGPGCYAFQVDGTTFSKVIVFEAARASTTVSSARGFGRGGGKSSCKSLASLSSRSATAASRLASASSCVLGSEGCLGSCACLFGDEATLKDRRFGAVVFRAGALEVPHPSCARCRPPRRPHRRITIRTMPASVVSTRASGVTGEQPCAMRRSGPASEPSLA
jgi:hypothetical protein